jgi:hypothetical protein
VTSVPATGPPGRTRPVALVPALAVVVALGTGCAPARGDAAGAPASTRPAPPVATGPRARLDSAPVLAPSSGSPAGGATERPPDPAPAARDVTGQAVFVPQRLTLPSGRTAPVVPVEAGADGALTIPADPARVGWWSGGARPGDPYGSVVIAGHIDSRRYGLGVLAEVVRARPGQLVRLAAASRQRAYRIVSVRQVPKARLVSGTSTFDQTGAPRLVLVTCGGRFDPATHTYADNVVVQAEPVD